MKTIKGPGIFLAQFAADEAPFNSLEGMAHWAAKLGFTGVQIPSWDHRLFNLEFAAESQSYCDEVRRVLDHAGLAITELSTHLQGQLVASHSAYDSLLAGFAPPEMAEDPKSRQAWAVQQMLWAAKASRNLGLNAHATFSGALAWPFFYPWPQRPAGLIDEAFKELGRRWLPILQAFDEVGVDVCFELHPGEDLHDGVTFERFLLTVNEHPRANILYDPSHMVLQQLDYLAFLDLYHDRVKAFHVKDAEFRPNGRSGAYGGYQDWIDRPGRFRSLGDGQVDFHSIFSKMAQYDFSGWAVLEWECCLKHPKVGAAEGATFIRDRIIHVTDRAFDDFAGSGADEEKNRRILGLESATLAHPVTETAVQQARTETTPAETGDSNEPDAAPESQVAPEAEIVSASALASDLEPETDQRTTSLGEPAAGQTVEADWERSPIVPSQPLTTQPRVMDKPEQKAEPATVSIQEVDPVQLPAPQEKIDADWERTPEPAPQPAAIEHNFMDEPKGKAGSAMVSVPEAEPVQLHAPEERIEAAWERVPEPAPKPAWKTLVNWWKEPESRPVQRAESDWERSSKPLNSVPLTPTLDPESARTSAVALMDEPESDHRAAPELAQVSQLELTPESTAKQPQVHFEPGISPEAPPQPPQPEQTARAVEPSQSKTTPVLESTSVQQAKWESEESREPKADATPDLEALVEPEPERIAPWQPEQKTELSADSEWLPTS